jgi:membrane dipeptidase
MTALRTTAIGLIFLALFVFFVVLPPTVGRSMNRVIEGSPAALSPHAEALHARLLIADLHADSLLWGRDLSARAPWGHVDIPRLIQGNVALQIFSVVTKTPRGQNIARNDDTTDNIFWLGLCQRWPPATWGSLKERALYQARKLDATQLDSAGRFVIVHTRAELADYLERRKGEKDVVAGLLGLEGAHALDGDLGNVDVLYDAGFRMMAPSHFFDNDIGGSAHGVAKGGLTSKGREMIRRMEAKHMIVDLAHASEKTFEDTLGMAQRPLVVSHTGVKGTCDNARNLSDEQLGAIARNGGVVGIGYWETATCAETPAAIARAIAYAARVAGVEHVGLGSDFDGATVVPFDTTRLVEITDALLAMGLSDEDTRKIMGGNELRLLGELLP